MPKAFTQEERQRIREDLCRGARRAFAREGYTGATVEGIAHAAGVGKGTFYLFYESKAALFVEVAAQLEEELRAKLLVEMNQPFPTAQDRLEHFFRALLVGLENHPILWILLDPQEGPAVFEDLTPEMGRRLNQRDDEFFEGIVSTWRDAGWIRPVEPEVLAGIGRALFAVSLRRSMVGEVVYESVADTLVSALASELAPE